MSGAQRVLATPLGLFRRQVVEPGLEPQFSDYGKKEADNLVPCYQLLSVPLGKVAQAFPPHSAMISLFSEIFVCRKGLNLVRI